jgi:hypothetical protein
MKTLLIALLCIGSIFVALAAFLILRFIAWPLFQPFQPEKSVSLYITDAQTMMTIYSRRTHPLPEFERRMTLKRSTEPVEKISLQSDPAGKNILELYTKQGDGGVHITLTDPREENMMSGSANVGFQRFLPTTGTMQAQKDSGPVKLGYFDTRRMKWVPNR